MGLYKQPKSPFWYYKFTINGHCFRGSTGTAERRAALAFERARRVEIERAGYRSGSTKTLREAADADVARAQAKGLTQKVILGGIFIHWKHLAGFFGEGSELAEFTLGGINS